MRRELLSRLWIPLQIGFVLLLCAALARFIYLRWDELRTLKVDLQPDWLLGAAALTMIFTFEISLTWQWLLRRVSPSTDEISSLALHKVFLTSFLTRYLPAGALVNIGGKVELLRRQGGTRSSGLETVLYEVVFMAGGGLFVAWVAFLAFPASSLLGRWQGLYPLGLLILAVGCLLCFLAPDRVLLWGRSLISKETASLALVRLERTTRAQAFVAYTLANVLQGTAVLCLLFAVYPGMQPDPGVMLHVIAAYPIGRLVGQATPFAPGGIGVREAAFTFLVLPWLPPEPVVISATLLRLLSVLIEIAAALLVIGLDRRASRRAPQADGPQGTGEDPG